MLYAVVLRYGGGVFFLQFEEILSLSGAWLTQVLAVGTEWLSSWALELYIKYVGGGLGEAGARLGVHVFLFTRIIYPRHSALGFKKLSFRVPSFWSICQFCMICRKGAFVTHATKFFDWKNPHDPFFDPGAECLE